jgi:phosphotriesterase-related protein
MTVKGPIAADSMGLTLTHEHVLVDFIGADKITAERYDRDRAFERILPYLERARDLGCQTFVECTPSYIGRDPALLKRLSEATSLNILTNTGYYGAADDKFVPRHAYYEAAQQLADRWVKEWEAGIGGTDVRPGFIKVGVDRGSLTEIDRKLVVAAAKTHTKTGLLILSHTGDATAAMEQIAILKTEGVHPSAWVWTHAQNEQNNDDHERAVQEGAWIAFDGLHKDRLDRDLKHLTEMKRRGCLEHVLLSHDAGWYQPGKPEGGDYRPHEDLFTTVIPAMQGNGFTEAEIHLLTVVNPRRAFAIKVRSV